MPVKNLEVELLIDEIKTIKRFGIAGLELPFEKVELYNAILDMEESTEGDITNG